MAAIVKQTLLHPEGPYVSRLVYGTWRLLDVVDDALKTPAAILSRIRRCVELGITTFDCADIYGWPHDHASERLFGDALRLDPTLRKQIQIISKTGIRLDTPVKHYDLSSEYIVRRVKESLEALGTDYLDVLLIHRPSPMMNAQEVADAFMSLHTSGTVRHFGVSNFAPSQIDLLQSRLPFPLVTNQIEINPLRLDPFHDGTLDHAQRLKMSPTAWSPLAGGAFFRDEESPRVEKVKSVLESVAKELGEDVTVDQVMYAWLLAHPSNIVVVLGTNSTPRIEQAAKATALTLATMQWFAILEASAGQPVP
ncbi:hypothetical protein HK104_001085 [Borealophlyctis nickersoniae]|nr:hypothetical protein HK104_001085 [Borealophlyctis nickersoniae]